jgi:hAT family C-terminal dimerisation region
MVGGTYYLIVIPSIADFFAKMHSLIYPTLSRIARDYLAIQGSSTPSERAFSSGGLTGTKLRNRLAPEIFEALQILKSGYRSGHIGAAAQAEDHARRAQELMDVLDDDEDCDMPMLTRA